MDYHSIRELFVKRSGRYDLVDSDWNDNGADFFLNAGQRLLDRLIEHDKSLARSYHTVVAGTWYAKTEGLEAIKEVWVTDSDGKVKLVKKSITELRDMYYEKPSELSTGTPKYYAPAVFRPYPDVSSDSDLSSFDDKDDILTTEDGGHFKYNGVIIMPPSDGSFTLSIWGKFRSPELTAVYAASAWTETKSYWSELNPDILLKAGLYELEAFYRNTEGVKDWKAILDVDLLSMDSMLADEGMSDVEEMEG